MRIRCTASRRGLSLFELMASAAVIGTIVAVGYVGWNRAVTQARSAKSMWNLRCLAAANLAYAVDHNGSLCPGSSINNLVRWHGSRPNTSSDFEPTGGYLSEYLDPDGRALRCPLLDTMERSEKSFEKGAGGYGYNAIYLGGMREPERSRRRDERRYPSPLRLSQIRQQSRTLMFATTAFARDDGIQEYPFADPYFAIDSHYIPRYRLQPSVHFRASAGKALVAWCDGHVTAEPPAQLGGQDFYGGDSAAERIGWIGPDNENGAWNPFLDHSAELSRSQQSPKNGS